MGNIVLLDENTANQIAAGEVIERPASVIKELVENSIDAGATNISIEIKNGGIKYIKITDNGCGIASDDVEIAFERHATSKIRSSGDLESISTLGFRGEALASIASVAKVDLTTRTYESTYGVNIKIEGGKVLDLKQKGSPIGTTFVIKDLFYNTPARFKFLKRDSTEAGYISDIVTKIALGNPQISFKLISNNSSVLHTPGNNDLQSAIYSIYGKAVAKEVLEVNYSDEKLNVYGFIGKPEIARSNRNYQSIYINGRYIKSPIITASIEEAYKTLLMKKKFAFAVLYIEVNPITVDVNVHPAKTEIRFSNEQEIFRSIYHAINNALHKRNLIREGSFNTEKKEMFKYENTTKNNDFIQENIKSVKNIDKNDTQKHFEFQKETFVTNKGNPSFEDIEDNREDKDKKKYSEQMHSTTKVIEPQSEINEVTSDSESKIDLDQNKTQIGSVPEQTITKNIDYTKKIEEKENTVKINETILDNNDLINDQPIPDETNIDIDKVDIQESIISKETEELNKFDLEDSIIIGQLFLTYILLQHEGSLILIDQHAAHERIIYEKLKKQYSSEENIAQILLSPIVIELTNQELKNLEENKNFFIKMGFNFDSFGNNSIILREIPYVIDISDAKDIFLNLLDNIFVKSKETSSVIVDEALYSLACKSAIKANKKLDNLEIKSILKQLGTLDNPYTCPHGRPTIIKVSKQEVEKMFKRIL